MVRTTLNEDLVRCARESAANLSEQVEKRRAEADGRLDAVITAWNEFDETYGSFADDHADL